MFAINWNNEDACSKTEWNNRRGFLACGMLGIREARTELSWDVLFLKEHHMTGNDFLPFTLQADIKKEGGVGRGQTVLTLKSPGTFSNQCSKYRCLSWIKRKSFQHGNQENLLWNKSGKQLYRAVSEALYTAWPYQNMCSIKYSSTWHSELLTTDLVLAENWWYWWCSLSEMATVSIFLKKSAYIKFTPPSARPRLFYNLLNSISEFVDL